MIVVMFSGVQRVDNDGIVHRLWARVWSVIEADHASLQSKIKVLTLAAQMLGSDLRQTEWHEKTPAMAFFLFRCRMSHTSSLIYTPHSHLSSDSSVSLLRVSDFPCYANERRHLGVEVVQIDLTEPTVCGVLIH